MSRETHVRFCEQLRVKTPGLTRLSDTVAGAEASSLLYSIVVTAKVNGINVYRALTKLLTEIPLAKTYEDYERLANIILSPIKVN